MQQQSANAESVEDGEESTGRRVGREMARRSPRRETGRKPRKWQSLIHPACECVCVFVHLCCVFICVHARMCNCGLYIYFPRSLPRAEREGGRGGGQDQWTMTLALQGMLLLKGQLRTRTLSLRTRWFDDWMIGYHLILFRLKHK